ncbi:hypothetical protein [Elizabethkingia meningoseptica]|uniref:hypothetical protein n=1 Tax=Elizabethkingia meningoseptica TaxID=238 RepID=UPI0023AF0ED9|nr:hypothetical protein [Elizabethkingia meningoseptica]HAY3552772.1 hypothetical protein [Elizabethkingia meningoseptica]
MSIINLFNYKSKIRTSIGFVCMLGLFFSCSRELTGESDTNPVKLTFNIEGVENINPLAKTASKEPASGSFKSTEEKKINFDGFNATLSLEESPMSNTPDKNTGLIKTSANTVQKLINPVAATLTGGVKYRVVLYDKSTNPSTFYSSTLGTAGTALSIPVEKGKNYDWAVFSYNDTNDPGVSNTTIQTDQRDLLHAASTTGTIPGTTGDGSMVNQPINVTLKHKLARIDVSVDATNYPATITNVSADLASANYFQNGTMDLKTGTISNLVPNNTNLSMSFSGSPTTKTATPSYYTAGTSVINPFSIKNTNVTINASGVSKSLSGATFNWVFTPIAGTIYTAKVNLRQPYDLNRFKILSVGNPVYTADKSGSSGVWKAMNDPDNFGPSGTIPTINATNLTARTSFTLQLYDLLDSNGNNNYDMLFIGYLYNFYDPFNNNSTIAKEIYDLGRFVQNGGTVIWYSQYEQLPDNLNVLKNFAGSGISYVNTNQSYVNTNNNSALTGKFGDATNKGFYSDTGVYGITNYDPTKIDVLSTNTNSSNITSAPAWKTKTGNFYYFGGAGMTRSDTAFLLNANGKPTIGTYAGNTNTANSVIIMNIVAKALMSSQ